MKKAGGISANKAREIKQTTNEISNLESTSSSYNILPKIAGSKTNMKHSHISKFNDGPNISGDAENDNRLRNTEEKSSPSSDGYENNKVRVGNQKEIVTRCQKKGMGSSSDGGKMHEEHSKSSEQETSLQSHHTDSSDESDVVEHDVKVCDICGDAGREDLLAICCRCPDGAEHTYCMKVMIDKVPEGDWLCEECELEETKITNRRRNSTETSAEKDQQSSDSASVKVSGKRRAEELESSSSFKKQALETPGSTKDVDRGKAKSSNHFSSDSHFGNETTEGSSSPVARPRLQSLQGHFSKSSSFNFPNAKSKTKLVDEVVFQRQKSTKERSSRDTMAAKEMSKSMSFRSTNLGRFGPSGSKVKMLSPNSSHVQDLRSLINKKERGFERTNSVKLNNSSSAALIPKGDKLLLSHGETNSVTLGSNSEAKSSKVDSKVTSGLKSNNRSVNKSAEASVIQGQTDKQLPSSPSRVGTASSSGTVKLVEHKSIGNSSKGISKETTNLADGIKENTTGLNPGTSGVSCQNNKQSNHSAQGSLGDNASAMNFSKDVKNGENKLKDAIEAALLKKPGIYRKNKISDQPNELSVPVMNNDASNVDRVTLPRNAGSLTSAEVSSTDGHGQISRTSSVDHSKQSNGNSHKPSMLLPADVAFSSLLKNPCIPDHECIWQGSFEITRSGKAAEFWDGLQAHLSTCASPRVFEAVNKFPRRISLNGVSRVSAWPTQFGSNGVKENNIAMYFFAKDLDSYEKSYLILLDEMIKSDLALIGSINGVELLIFPSNQLPEKSNRWNMLFFLWGVFRGKKKNLSEQTINNREKSCAPQSVSPVSTDKMPLAENASLIESIEKDKHDDSESNVNSKLQNPSHEKETDGVYVVPPGSKERISDSHMQNENKKRSLFDLSEDVDLNSTNQIDTYHEDKHDNLESKVNSKLQNPLHEKATDIVNVVRPSSKERISESHMQHEPKKHPLIDLSQDVNLDSTSQMNTWRDDKQVDSESKVNSKLQNPLHENAAGSVDIVPACSKEINAESHMKNEPKKRPFIDLSEDVDLNSTSEINTWHDVSGQVMEEDGNCSKKQKNDLYEQNSNLNVEKTDAGNSNDERYFFPVDRGKTQQKPVFALDLNEDITYLSAEDDNVTVEKNDNDDVASSLSLSLAFSPPGKDKEDNRDKDKWQSGSSMLLYRDMVDK